jgi:hypothetical protein
MKIQPVAQVMTLYTQEKMRMTGGIMEIRSTEGEYPGIVLDIPYAEAP